MPSILFFFNLGLFAIQNKLQVNKTIINKLIDIKLKIDIQFGRSDCGGEISEKQILFPSDFAAEANSILSRRAAKLGQYSFDAKDFSCCLP